MTDTHTSDDCVVGLLVLKVSAIFCLKDTRPTLPYWESWVGSGIEVRSP